MATVGFGVASVAGRQGEAASCSGIGHGGVTGGCGAGAAAMSGSPSWGVKRVGGGVARGKHGAKGGSAAPLRCGKAVAAAGSSNLGAGASATPGAASTSRNHHRRRGDEKRGLGLVTDAVAVNKSTPSLDEMDPEHVTFASQDELDHR